MRLQYAQGRRPAALLCAIAWLSLAAGCTLEPRYRAPALPVPDRWPIPATTVSDAASDTAGAGAGATETREIGWRDFFVDPRLQRLIELALSNNRDLRVAVLNIERARAQYRIQRAALLPQIDATASYTRESYPPALSFGFAYTTSYYDLGVGVSSYEVDLFGRVRSLTHAALEQYMVQEETRRGAQLSLIAEIANAYLTLAADRELRQLAQQTLESQQKSFDLAQKQHEIGSASGLDLAQAKTTVEQARADAARYEGNVAQDTDALTLLVGTTLDPSWLPEQFDSSIMGIEALPAGLPSNVLLRRPDVLEAEHTLRGANANIGAARAAFFPQITLTADIGTASAQLAGLFKAGTETWAFLPQATLPIFHAGALRAGLAVSKVDRDVAVAQYEKAIQSGFREVADGLALTATLARQRAAQQALVDATQSAFELSQRRYKSGRDSYLVVLDSQRSNYTAQQGLITTRMAEQSNRVTLYEALGGGWLEHSP
jgi:outer membrane protein, multidrug efflux system